MSTTSKHRRVLALAFTAGAALVFSAVSPVTAGAAEGTIRNADAPSAITGSYIVTLKSTAHVRSMGVPAMARSLAGKHSGRLSTVYRQALRGFSVKMSAAQARKLAASSDVAAVEQNQVLRISETQNNAPWGLDRLDQRNLPLSTTYTYDTTASNVTAYIVDTGVRTTHTTFGSPSRARSGWDFVDDDNDATDCNGHGTHVAGTVAGGQFGVAKGAKVVAVRVLDCQGSGTTAGVIAGVDWVTQNAVKPAVANMSLGGGASTSLDNAVANSIASGVTYGVAAGNENTNACNSSPARVGTAITVGATQRNDARASFSNFGSCLDIFAPGVDILSSWSTSNTATNTISGTSMATPHVVGAAALVLAANPGFTPAQVRSALVGRGTTGKVTGPGSGSPNVLLYTGP